MLRAYNIRWGIFFAFIITIMTFIGRVIREGLGQFTFHAGIELGSILLCWMIHHFFLLHGTRLTFIRPSMGRTITSITAAMLLVYSINYFVGTYANFSSFWGNPVGLTKEKILLINLFRSSIVSGFTYFVVYYLQVTSQLQKSRLENEYLKQDQLKAQLFALQQQLSPHFLFNSLSTLKTIAPNEETKTYVMQLSNVYRYLLTFHDHQQITLKAELAFTTSYLYILQERYEEALQVRIDISERFLQYTMPPLTLQILVENAVKHNVISIDQPLYLKICTDDNDWLTVENSYQPKRSVEESNGKGLQNIKDRYQLLAGRSIEVCQNDLNFKVSLPLLAPGTIHT